MPAKRIMLSIECHFLTFSIFSLVGMLPFGRVLNDSKVHNLAIHLGADAASRMLTILL